MYTHHNYVLRLIKWVLDRNPMTTKLNMWVVRRVGLRRVSHDKSHRT